MSWSSIKRQTCLLILIAVSSVHAPYWERTRGFSALLTKQEKKKERKKQTEKRANVDSKVPSHCQVWLYHMCSFLTPAVDTSASAFFCHWSSYPLGFLQNSNLSVQMFTSTIFWKIPYSTPCIYIAFIQIIIFIKIKILYC